MELFRDFQPYQLYFSGCHLNYLELIFVDGYHLMQLREALITAQNQSAYRKIFIRLRKPDLLIDRFVIWTFFFLNIHNSFLPHAGTVGLLCRAFTLL